MEMPKELLSKILLELPPNILCDLKQSMAYMPIRERLMKLINEKLSELSLLGKRNELSQPDKISSVASLLSLSAIAICRYHQGSIVGNIEKPLYWFLKDFMIQGILRSIIFFH
ncbi:hypothetical protein CLAVI_000321 [Candidatus Clavichlamydia salmonicola]|uniref:hypothetical protein n=1 Tax=Candidatus Clavichlamydia salmonicola TaxID=469812 RepID=UPI001891D630|nr:hypothetical protein [Candidatus Clavichlamydia salmonicola]MBF5050706.1 hypothetical protein [Candidatus Clavichlamydia salmonicola]